METKDIIELNNKFDENTKLVHFKHYSKKKVDKKLVKSRKKKYIVRTINLTYATENNKQNYSKQHKNKYILTMEALELWGFRMVEVAEQIISIRRKLF